MKLLAVYTTVATQDDARRIAAALVAQKLAACAQITEIESFYAWDGAVRHEPEFRILFKTVEALYPQLEAAIRDLHPYQLPAIHALPLAHVEPGYAAWVALACQAE